MNFFEFIFLLKKDINFLEKERGLFLIEGKIMRFFVYLLQKEVVKIEFPETQI
jgi:hypothetical protein